MKPLHITIIFYLVMGLMLATTGNAGTQKRGGIRQCDQDRLQDRTNCTGATNCFRSTGITDNQPAESCGKKEECTNACVNACYRIRTRLRNRLHVNGGLCLSNCWENAERARLTLRLGPLTVCSNSFPLQVRRRSAIYNDAENGGRVKICESTNGMVRIRFRYLSMAPENPGLQSGSNFTHRVRCRLGGWYGETETGVVQTRQRTHKAVSLE
jgi:hypothetical protein